MIQYNSLIVYWLTITMPELRMIDHLSEKPKFANQFMEETFYLKALCKELAIVLFLLGLPDCVWPTSVL